MKKIIVVVFVLSLVSAAYAAGITVGPLQDESVIDIGCSFQYPQAKNKTMASTDYEYKTLWINLNGKDTKFNLTKSVGADMTSESFKKGSSYTKIYKNGSQTVEMVNTSTGSACAGEEGCELEGVSAKFKINDGKETQVIETQGSCGA